MKKIIRKKVKSNQNIHLQAENEYILAKITYLPTCINGEFLYSLLLYFKDSNTEVNNSIGCFNITKAKHILGSIIIEENLVKVIPKKRPTKVYNLHESDTKEYIFEI